jgi:hypothetical protein
VVRNRGQPELWKRRVDRTPSTTTALSRISEIAPAPLVVYQRIVLFTEGGYEPPETATPELDEELTDPDEDDDTPLEEDELEVLEPTAAAALAEVPEVVDEGEELETPGIVIALTVPRIPTPATAAKAMTAVKLFSSESARSRARILASADFVFSMVIRLRSPSQSSL